MTSQPALTASAFAPPNTFVYHHQQPRAMHLSASAPAPAPTPAPIKPHKQRSSVTNASSRESTASLQQHGDSDGSGLPNGAGGAHSGAATNNRPAPRPWTAPDDKRLMEAYHIVFEKEALLPDGTMKNIQRNRGWQKVADMVGGRTANSCFSRHRLLTVKGGPTRGSGSAANSQEAPPVVKTPSSASSTTNGMVSRTPSFAHHPEPHVHHRNHPYMNWSPAEDQRLAQLVHQYHSNWGMVARGLHNRVPAECLARWHAICGSVMKTNEMNHKPWTDAEIKWLFVLVYTELHRFGSVRWPHVAKELGTGRTQHQCHFEYTKIQNQRTAILGSARRMLTYQQQFMPMAMSTA
ncbi:hypothetical protein GQ42DRAFT_165909 [Ramicandelaber brevisporus]|nr:hypothetical protein GQ42DRAFT_165909 [Ramicandelaber brevisporus]